MSELPISSKYRSTPTEPVSEDERNDLTRRLNEAFEAGGLTQDDYSARLDQLYAAQQLGELVPVVEGLPAVQSYAEPDMVGQPATSAPGELTEAKPAHRMTVAVIVAIVAIVIVLAVLLLLLF
jgi:hypothetical protein